LVIKLIDFAHRCCSSFQEFGNANGSQIQVHTRPFEVSKGNSKFDINLKLKLLNLKIMDNWKTMDGLEFDSICVC
jgi:hypothetical protein